MATRRMAIAVPNANTTCHGCPQEVSHGVGCVGGEERRRGEGTCLACRRSVERKVRSRGGLRRGVGCTELILSLNVGVCQMPGERWGCRVTRVVRHGEGLEARCSEEVRCRDAPHTPTPPPSSRYLTSERDQASHAARRGWVGGCYATGTVAMATAAKMGFKTLSLSANYSSSHSDCTHCVYVSLHPVHSPM